MNKCKEESIKRAKGTPQQPGVTPARTPNGPTRREAAPQLELPTPAQFGFQPVPLHGRRGCPAGTPSACTSTASHPTGGWGDGRGRWKEGCLPSIGVSKVYPGPSLLVPASGGGGWQWSRRWPPGIVYLKVTPLPAGRSTPPWGDKIRLQKEEDWLSPRGKDSVAAPPPKNFWRL